MQLEQLASDEQQSLSSVRVSSGVGPSDNNGVITCALCRLKFHLECTNGLDVANRKQSCTHNWAQI